ncbi:MAG: histidine--tRNA ligase [candidate division Zixibacteria bacterium]|nr:histidine--tRNA ligase [candidate division Zixibacteria bacterium]
MDIKRLHGTMDLLPEAAARWTEFERRIRKVMLQFGFGEIRVPIMEPTELFAKGTGESTDIVQKEMYTFEDRGGRSITLRPEGTPSVVRAFLEHSLGAQRPSWKLYYIGPMFRAERPQQGRYRQFHQFGAEFLGTDAPHADVELIALAYATLTELGLREMRLLINSIGSPDARRAHDVELRKYLRDDTNWKRLCADCHRRTESNPLRVFDCKVEQCIDVVAGAPTIDGFLTDDDRAHFHDVQTGLKSIGLPYEVDVRMVRGLDYYTRTTFEIKAEGIGSQDSLCGGGRYDLLVETLDGPPTPAVGFASGIERILSTLEANGIELAEPPMLDVFVCALGAAAIERLPQILNRLRALGFTADGDFLGRGLKAQMKDANRRNARVAILIGDNEIERGQYTLRRMDDSQQTEIPADTDQWTAETFRT